MLTNEDLAKWHDGKAVELTSRAQMYRPGDRGLESDRPLRDIILEDAAFHSSAADLLRQGEQRPHFRDNRQKIVADWCAAAFGVVHATNLPQRGIRLAEEAIEAAQSAGTPAEMIHRMVDFVYARPPGELKQELGGVAMTLLALAAAAGLSADEAEVDEMLRVLNKPLEHFTARNEAKNAAGFGIEAPAP